MKKVMLLLLIVTMLAACGQTDDTSSSTDNVVEPIRAQLKVPQQADSGKTVTLKVTVTQGGKAITNADEVKFEIWREGSKKNSDMINAKHTKNGMYMIEKTFNQKGIYYVQSHVTAKHMHTMPKTKINIGNTKASK